MSGRHVDGADAVRALVRGAPLDNLAWSASVAPEALLDAAREAVVALNPELAGRLEPAERHRVIDHLLRQAPADPAAATRELLEGDADARRLALYVREALGKHYAGAPPPIPGVEPIDAGAGTPAPRAKEPARESAAKRRRVPRRERRVPRRERRVPRRAADAPRSPFRRAALEHYKKRQEHVQLPDFASRGVVWSLWTLIAVVAACLVLVFLARVPNTASGLGFVVTDVPRLDGAGPAVVATLPASRRDDLRRARGLRLRLSLLDDQLTLEVRRVDGVLDPQTIRRRYGLDPAVADAVQAPSAVVVGRLEGPGSTRRASGYVGAVGRVQATLGTRRLRTLMPAIGAVVR